METYWFDELRQGDEKCFSPEPAAVHKPKVQVAGCLYHQKAIAALYISEKLCLIPEPENEHDSNAVAVCRLDGQRIGYWPRKSAAAFKAAFLLDGTASPDVEIESISRHRNGRDYVVRVSIPEQEETE